MVDQLYHHSLTLLAFYFAAANMSYGILLFLSWLAVKKRVRKVKDLNKTLIIKPKSISVIIPAHNEEAVIIHAVHAYLQNQYDNFEIIVVSDGSSDKTVAVLVDHFKMKKIAPLLKRNVSDIEIEGVWHSSSHPKVRLIAQSHSGKAMAINTGVDFSHNELICTADADSTPETNALSIMAREFVDPNIVAVGCALRILNGSITDVTHSKVLEGRLPKGRPLALLQILEYIRSFYCGRTGWDYIHATHLLSGAFTLFRRDKLIEVRGMDQQSITEDFEIVMRLLKNKALRSPKDKIILIPEPLCWTQVPLTLAHLRRQRIRWQRGLVETVLPHLKMLFNPYYKSLGFTAIPYLLLFEVFGPVIELIAYGAVTYGVISGELRSDIVLEILSAGIAYTLGITFLAVGIEEHFFSRHKHNKFKVYFKFLAYSIFDIFGYRQLLWFWRLEATVLQLFNARKSWGHKKRYQQSSITKKPAA